LDMFGNIDSKFRFVILASKRAKQLLKGAKPKIKAKSRNLIRIAQAEVKSGLIEYEILPERAEELPDAEERVFVGGGIADEALEVDTAGKEPAAEEVAEEETEEAGEEEEEEDLDEVLKDEEKDE
jgi:DNA-directed RNA polymerase omega subunit